MSLTAVTFYLAIFLLNSYIISSELRIWITAEFLKILLQWNYSAEAMRYMSEYYIKKEIDFIAIKRNEKIHIHVSDNISDEKTFEWEVSPLLQIKDAYPKMIIARTHHNEYQYEGVKIVDIADWLLN